MVGYVIALEIGIGGLRCQALESETGNEVSTAIAERNPIPGSNYVDHVRFISECGMEVSNGLIIITVNKLFRLLDIDLNQVERIDVCGDTLQLSVLQNLDLSDLLSSEDGFPADVEYDGGTFSAEELGLETVPNAEVVVPSSTESDTCSFKEYCNAKILDYSPTLTGCIKRCMDCRLCVKECPEKALSLCYVGGVIVGNIVADRCLGTNCRKCETVCCNNSLKLNMFEVEPDYDI